MADPRVVFPAVVHGADPARPAAGAARFVAAVVDLRGDQQPVSARALARLPAPVGRVHERAAVQRRPFDRGRQRADAGSSAVVSARAARKLLPASPDSSASNRPYFIAPAQPLSFTATSMSAAAPLPSSGRRADAVRVQNQTVLRRARIEQALVFR